MRRLSSGIRINSASDDAAGLSLSQKLTSVINGNTVAKNNAQTGIAMLNTADGALSVMTNSLERIRNLAVQSANGVYSASERQMLQKEVYQLSADIQNTYNTTRFSDINIFSGVSESTGASDAALIAAGYTQAHIIHNASELVSKIAGHETENFILASDIDLSSLGTLTHAAIMGNFSGTFDGNGHTISNLSIDTGGAATNNIGLFAQSTGTIKNLTLQNANIVATNSEFIGGIAGIGGTMTNVAVFGANITAGSNHNCLGGLIGWQTSGTITYSHVSATSITAGDGSTFTGGLVGYAEFGLNMYNSYASATISLGKNASYVGGFTGDMNGNYERCYSAGSINTGINAIDVGGFGAGADRDVIRNCYSTVDVTVGAVSDRIAGFASYVNGATIQDSYATGSVNAPSSSNVGGFAGILTSGSVDASNFYKNNMSVDAGSAVDANVLPAPTTGWDGAVWDKAGDPPQLKNMTMSYTPITGGGGGAGGSGSFTVQVGSDAQDSSQINLNSTFTLPSLSFDISNQSSSAQSVNDADTLLKTLNEIRSKVGADTNKLTSVLNILDSRVINLSSSKSTLHDADIAAESAQMVKNQIRMQASTSLMSQVHGLDANLLMQLIG